MTTTTTTSYTSPLGSNGTTASGAAPNTAGGSPKATGHDGGITRPPEDNAHHNAHHTTVDGHGNTDPVFLILSTFRDESNVAVKPVGLEWGMDATSRIVYVKF